ncbi:MAG: hypothetical protein C0502_07520 [Opitutus sp.]|nr:hypothetical protein [Opitutus sp.]
MRSSTSASLRYSSGCMRRRKSPQPAAAGEEKAAVASPRGAGIKGGVPEEGSSRPPFPATAWLRYAVSFGVLAWVGWQVARGDVGGLRFLDWHALLPAVLLAGLAYPLQAWRWQMLLAAQGVPLSPVRAHVLFWIGNFYNSFLPGGIAGDAVRLVAAWREHPANKAAVAASVVADRLLGLGALLALAVLALGGQLASAGAQGGLKPLFLASAGALVLLALGAFLLTHPAVWMATARQWLGAERATSLRQAAEAMGRNRRTLLAASALSVAVWLLDFTALWLLAKSVRLAIDPLAAAVAAAAAYVAAALPISVGGHGIREGTLVMVLGWLGIGGESPDRVSLLALGFWLVSTLWSLAGVAAVFAPRQWRGSNLPGGK